MAEEVKDTQGEEVKIPTEGTVEAEIAKEVEKSEVVKETKEPQTVPLSVYLALKDDVKELKQIIKESSKSEKSSVTIEGIKDLTKKYPDVNEEFLQDILTSATKNAQAEIDKEYKPIIQKQEEERTKKAFDEAFDKVFDKALKDNPDLPKNIDKNVIKALALTPEYKTKPIGEILKTLYTSEDTDGKNSSENEMRNNADRVDDIVNFDKITPEQRKAVMADPVARAKYFKFLDTQ